MLIEKLKDLEIFENISEATIKKIISYGEIKEYEISEMLFEDKQVINTIYIIISGTVSLYKINSNGQKKVIFILDKGKVINEVIIKEIPASINCEILDKSVILGIERSKLLSIMQDDFELCKNIIISLSMKTRRMYRQLKNTPTSIKLEKKLAAKLYKLGRDYGVKHRGGILIDMDLTITYIADLLGSQRESVSRAMKFLKKENLIEYENKKIYIPSLLKLSEFFKSS